MLRKHQLDLVEYGEIYRRAVKEFQESITPEGPFDLLTPFFAMPMAYTRLQTAMLKAQCVFLGISTLGSGVVGQVQVDWNGNRVIFAHFGDRG
jgi:hypothetical protein